MIGPVKPRPRIAPSILAANFTCLGQELKAVERAGADLVHIDVMDGHFVPNISFGPLIVEACRRNTSLPLDVHLMIQNPDHYIADFVRAGANLLTVHIEASADLGRDIEAIRNGQAVPGLAVNPGTPVEAVFPFLDRVGMVLLMTVEPGFGGQKFMPEVTQKIRALRAEIISRGLPVDIEVDGGINLETAGAVLKDGAGVLVAGSSIFRATNYQAIIERLKTAKC